MTDKQSTSCPDCCGSGVSNYLMGGWPEASVGCSRCGSTGVLATPAPAQPEPLGTTPEALGTGAQEGAQEDEPAPDMVRFEGVDDTAEQWAARMAANRKAYEGRPREPQRIKIQPGDEMHLTVLGVPYGFNFLMGKDRQDMLAFGRAVWAAAMKEAGAAAPVEGAPASWCRPLPLKPGEEKVRYVYTTSPTKPNDGHAWEPLPYAPSSRAPAVAPKEKSE